MTLKHIVIFQYKQSSDKHSVNEITQAFLSLEKSVPEVLAMEWGENISPEDHHQGFTHCYTLTFASLEKLEIYQQHPSHKAFQEILQPHLKNVFVVDYFAQSSIE